MEILVFLINKVVVFFFVLAILYVMSEGFRLIRGLNTGEYDKSEKRLLWAGLSVSYIITVLVTGFII